LSLIFLLAVAAPAFAADTVGALPRMFAGYSQPAIGPDACKARNASETDCVIPAMTAGRYLIEATGISSAPGAGASQVLQIQVAGSQCGVGRDNAPWQTGSRAFHLDCEVVFAADQPVMVKVIYADAQATKDPKGPAVTIRPLPWTGVLSTEAFAPRQ
jgi:hypothetical protein